MINAASIQIDGLLSTGQTHWPNKTAGTINANHNACTDTSALVGGSQQPFPKRARIGGMGTCNNCNDANNSPAHSSTNASSFHANMRFGQIVVQESDMAAKASNVNGRT
jgi:hypothetical protein